MVNQVKKRRSTSDLEQTTSLSTEHTGENWLFPSQDEWMRKAVVKMAVDAERRNFDKFRTLFAKQFGTGAEMATFNPAEEAYPHLTRASAEETFSIVDREFVGAPWQPRIADKDIPRVITIGKASYEVEPRGTHERKDANAPQVTHAVYLGLFGDLYMVRFGQLEIALYAMRAICASKAVQAHLSNRMYAAAHTNARSEDLIANFTPILDVARGPYGRLTEGGFEHPWYVAGENARTITADFAPWEMATQYGKSFDIYSTRKQVIDVHEDDPTQRKHVHFTPGLSANQGTPIGLQLSFRNLRAGLLERESRSAGLFNQRLVTCYPDGVQWINPDADLGEEIVRTFYGDQLHLVGEINLGKKSPIAVCGRQEANSTGLQAVSVLELSNTQKQHVFNFGFLFFDRIPVDNDFTSHVCKDEAAEKSWEKAKGAFVQYVNLGVLPLTELPVQVLSKGTPFGQLRQAKMISDPTEFANEPGDALLVDKATMQLVAPEDWPKDTINSSQKAKLYELAKPMWNADTDVDADKLSDLSSDDYGAYVASPSDYGWVTHPGSMAGMLGVLANPMTVCHWSAPTPSRDRVTRAHGFAWSCGKNGVYSDKAVRTSNVHAARLLTLFGYEAYVKGDPREKLPEWTLDNEQLFGSTNQGKPDKETDA